MTSSEEDSYSTIFVSLKHPIRRKILRILSSEPQTFSDLQKQFKIESSHLTYHIDGLGNLLYKTDNGKYALSSLGEAAISTITKVEDIPTTANHQSQQTRPNRRIGKSVAIALGLICVVLIAFTAYFAVAGISAQNSYVNLQKQNNQLQTWLTGNETLLGETQIWLAGNDTLLSQTQVNNTNLQDQIRLVNSNITNLQNEINNLHIINAENSTVWVNNTYVETGGVTNGFIEAAIGWFNYVPSAGYISVRVSSNDSSTFVGFENYNANSTFVSFENWTNWNVTGAAIYFPEKIDVGFGGTVVIPVLPNSMEIWVGSINEARTTVTITYYY